VKVQLHSFLTSALDGVLWSPPRSGRFTPGEWAPGIHWLRCGVSPMVGPDVFRKRNIPLAPTGLLHKDIALIYTNCIKIMIMLNAKSAVLRINVISDLLFTSNIGHTKDFTLAFKYNLYTIRTTQTWHTHGECTSKEHVDIRLWNSTLHVFQCVAQCCRILLTRYFLRLILQKVRHYIN